MDKLDKINKTIMIMGVGCITVSSMLQAEEQSSLPTVPPAYEWGDQASLPPAGYVFPKLSYKIPYDLGSLQQGGAPHKGSPGNELAQFQKQFDMFSWATFIGLNWPADNEGKPLTSVKIGSCNSATRVWEHYMAPQDFFKKNGEAPNPWGQPQQELKDLPFISKDPHVLNELDEAFFNLETPMPSITDLNNEYVRFEVRFNKVEYDYMLPFHTKEKQASFVKAGGKFDFPKGKAAAKGQPGNEGAMELKVAWKKIGPGDDPNKFYTITASYEDSSMPNGGKRGHGLYGMVGMHIAVRTESAPQWVWATFEHVDNAPKVSIPFGDNKKEVDGLGKKYSFWNEEGKDSITGFDQSVYEGLVELGNKRAKAEPSESGNYFQEKKNRQPSQIAQVITENNSVVDSEWTKSLNAHMHEQLKGTIWENYRLVSTQWPSVPDAPIPTGYNVSLGVPAPVSLGNAVLETYLQVNGSCMGCHAGATTELNGVDKQSPTNFSFMLQRATSIETNPIKTK